MKIVEKTDWRCKFNMMPYLKFLVTSSYIALDINKDLLNFLTILILYDLLQYFCSTLYYTFKTKNITLTKCYLKSTFRKEPLVVAYANISCHFHVRIELHKTTIIISLRRIPSLSALWCASGAGHICECTK